MLEFHPPRNLTTIRIDKLILNCRILSFYSDCYLCRVGTTPSGKLTKTAKMRHRAADISLILQGFTNHIDKLFCLLLLGFKNSIRACIRKSKLRRIKSDDMGANERKIHSRKKLPRERRPGPVCLGDCPHLLQVRCKSAPTQLAPENAVSGHRGRLQCSLLRVCFSDDKSQQ